MALESGSNSVPQPSPMQQSCQQIAQAIQAGLAAANQNPELITQQEARSDALMSQIVHGQRQAQQPQQPQQPPIG